MSNLSSIKRSSARIVMCPDGPARTGLVPTEFISACLRSCSSAPISFFPPSLPKPPRSWKHGAWMRPAQGEIKIWPCAQIFPLHRKQDRQIRTGTIPRHAYRHVHFGSYNNALIALLHGPNLTNSVSIMLGVIGGIGGIGRIDSNSTVLVGYV